jgi:hypothetical protein
MFLRSARGDTHIVFLVQLRFNRNRNNDITSRRILELFVLSLVSTAYMLVRIYNAITIYSLIQDVIVGHTTVCIVFLIFKKKIDAARGGGSVVKCRCDNKRVHGSNPVTVTILQSLSFLIT